MARTIKQIHDAMISELRDQLPTLSRSAVAEWRLLTWVVSAAIHSFELILDAFRTEISSVADKIIPGTVRWYIERCKRFQNGHELLFDEQTAELYYKTDDAAARIVSVVAVTEGAERLSIKAAKIDAQNRIVPLSADELYNFTGYVDAIKFAGIETITISTTADSLLYSVEVLYDPAIPATIVRGDILAALDRFRTEIGFNSMLYRQRFVDAIMNVRGVVTADLKSISRKGSSMTDFAPVGVADELESGYFDYATDSTLTLTSSRAAR